MNVFVTGGAGYIGSVCTEELLNAGHQVTVYDNLSEGHRAAVDPRAKFILGRPEEEGNILAAVKSVMPDAILHFAAFALVGESMTNPKKYFHNNFVNALKLADAAVECGVKKFVFSSTCATYGPPDRVPMTEDLPQRPINPYGESKLMFEKALLWYQQIYGLEFIAFRYFNAAGASDRFGEHHRIESHLIPNVLAVALGKKTQVEVFGTDYPTPDGTCIRDYIHIKDLAQAHILGLRPGKSGFFNLGNGDGYSVKQVIEMCEKITGKKIPSIAKPRRAGDPPKLVAAANKAFTELGWKPQYPKLEDIVKTAWSWHQKNPDGYPALMADGSPPKKNILFVEDNALIIQIYRSHLEKSGFHVEVAEDGLEAMRKLVPFKPDLVLLDLLMPKVDGTHVLKYIREQPSLKDTKVIILSDATIADAAHGAMALKPDRAFLKSECTLKQLLAAVRDLLKVSDAAKSAPIAEPTIQWPPAD